jgi:FkbM family methyltransferase
LFLKTPSGYKGFYVDIGAYHPIKFSNTYYFYQKGWRGINIDANPHSIKEFNKERSNDINIESGVSENDGELEYYYFGENDTINTFDKILAKQFEIQYDRKIKEIQKIKVEPINSILEKYLPKGQHIDLMTIDVEGFELRIVESLDFEKYSPDYFLLEDLDFANKPFCEMGKSRLYQFLNLKGYMCVGATHLTMLFMKGLEIGK